MRSDARKRLTAAREEGCGAEGGVVSGELREVWGIQIPPSVYVGREYPERKWAANRLPFTPGGVLVRRFVTEWEPATVSEPTS